MLKHRISLGFLSIFAVLTLTACGEGDTSGDSGESQTTEPQSEESSGMEHSADEMSSSGEVPDGLEEADEPKFEVGSTAIIQADHMSGMDDAEATISGAFDTTVYTVSYIPTNGGDKVEDHKWVIHEELEDPGDAPLEQGDEVVMNARHMVGMNGADATIDSAKQTTVYMVDFKTTDTDEKVKNHKWVVESELTSPEEK